MQKPSGSALTGTVGEKYTFENGVIPMKVGTSMIGIAVALSVLLGGCTVPEHSGPVVKGDAAKIIAGGIGQDVPARVYQEFGMDTTCVPGSGGNGERVYPCPDDQGFPHIGGVCGNMKWSVQFTNDHPYDGSEEKYGLPNNETLVYSLQQWQSQETVRFYWIRYSDTGCRFTDNDVIYCIELASLSKQDSRDHGCIKAMHRTFPGLDTVWTRGLPYAEAHPGSANATSASAPGDVNG